MKRRGGFWGLVWLLVLMTTMDVMAAKPFKFQDRPHFEGISAKRDWCDAVVDLKLTALQDPALFNPPDSEYLQLKVLGTTRAALSIACPAARKITFTGWYRGDLYYAAAASADNGWRLVGIYAPP